MLLNKTPREQLEKFKVEYVPCKTLGRQKKKKKEKCYVLINTALFIMRKLVKLGCLIEAQ